MSPNHFQTPVELYKLPQVPFLFVRDPCFSSVVEVYVQGGSNMTGTDLFVRLYKSGPVIFEPPCILVVMSSTRYSCQTVIKLELA